ncbi:MAG: GTP-binding protein [Candidatus Shikimatogenerans sp. Tder]|uniref:GTP-binding protein n=1 Tax=Candidatus Shikimatogenerans sp. Tder TaxID=3158566 RepID=A0AAU7QR96_9FLAO
MNKKIKIISNSININNLSLLINIKKKYLIKKCNILKLNINENQILNNNIITLLCEEYNYSVKFIKKYNINIKKNNIYLYKPKNIIIAIMGHVNHGKTTFINNISNKDITQKEKHNITQKTNIYNLKYKKKNLIFIDTPGHKDFINLRYQCLKIINIILLFISCETNKISEQTKEILNYLKNYNIKTIFVITKIDIINKKNNINYIINYLIKKKIIFKKYGGKYLLNKISSKKNIGVKKLLNNILIINKNNNKYLINPIISTGYIINSFYKKNIGYIQTIILKNGNLKIGNYILCNNNYGKIKKIIYNNKNIKNININIPIKIIGLKNSYNLGDKFYIYNKKKDLNKHKKYIINNINKQNIILNEKKSLKKNKKLLFSKKKYINIILKADLLSSIDAIINIINILNKKYKNIINIIKYNIKNIYNNDLKLAINTNSIIINFNKKNNINIKNFNKIKIKNFFTIYEIYNYLNNKIKKYINKKKNIYKGVLLVKKIYKINNKNICGCLIIKGKIKKKYFIKIIRNKKTILKKSKIISLKNFNKNISILKKGNLCSLIIKNFNNYIINDILKVF